MANYNIGEAGKATRFKKGNKLAAAANQRPEYVKLQRALRYMSRQKIDPQNLESLKTIVPPNATGIEHLAFALLMGAMFGRRKNWFKPDINEGNIWAVKFVAKLVDGPTRKAPEIEEEEQFLQDLAKKYRISATDSEDLVNQAYELLLKSNGSENTVFS